MNTPDTKPFDFGEFADLDALEGAAPGSIDLIALAKDVLKRWKTILLCGFCAAVAGILIGFSIPRTYVSTAIVAPELTTRGSAGGLTSLANLAGINVNSMAVTDAMHPDMYPAIVMSTDFAVSLFDMPVEVKTKDGIVNTDLYDYMLNYTKSPWWSPILAFPMVMKEKIVSLFKEEDEFEVAEGHSEINPVRLTREQERVAKSLAKSISIAVAKKTYILTIRAKMQDRMVAAQLCQKVVDNLQRFVIDYRTERKVQNVEYYKYAVEATRADFLSAQQAYAEYVDRNQSVLRKSAQIESQQLQNEANLRFQIYNTMCQNLLSAEAKVKLEAPVLFVIQKPLAPNIGKPSKVKLAVLFFILGCMGAAFFFLVKSVFVKEQ